MPGCQKIYLYAEKGKHNSSPESTITKSTTQIHLKLQLHCVYIYVLVGGFSVFGCAKKKNNQLELLAQIRHLHPRFSLLVLLSSIFGFTVSVYVFFFKLIYIVCIYLIFYPLQFSCQSTSKVECLL